MAATDILFQVGESQEFIMEIPAGTLNAPTDVVFDASGEGMLEMDIPPQTNAAYI